MACARAGSGSIRITPSHASPLPTSSRGCAGLGSMSRSSRASMLGVLCELHGIRYLIHCRTTNCALQQVCSRQIGILTDSKISVGPCHFVLTPLLYAQPCVLPPCQLALTSLVGNRVWAKPEVLARAEEEVGGGELAVTSVALLFPCPAPASAFNWQSPHLRLTRASPPGPAGPTNDNLCNLYQSGSVPLTSPAPSIDLSAPCPRLPVLP